MIETITALPKVINRSLPGTAQTMTNFYPIVLVSP